MTLLDLLILVVALAAAVTGYRTLGGSGRAGGVLGLLVGAGVGSALGAWLTGLATDGPSEDVLTVVGILTGLLLGAAAGGLLGRALSRILVGGRLAMLDRALGALAGAASALLVIWLLAVITPALVGPRALEPVTDLVTAAGGHSVVVSAVGHTVPTSVRAAVASAVSAVSATRADEPDRLSEPIGSPWA